MPLNSVISYPISAYQNLPIHAEYYEPNRFVISGITLGVQTTVTTTINHNYVIGQLVRLIIPSSFGSRGLNEQTGYVISIPSLNQILLDLNSVGIDPFISSSAKTQAQILSIGGINTGAINTSGGQNLSTFIPGSFLDISPL